ncbi:MAG: alpha-ketoglutarate-dependent dioxygenase AlkB [Brevundimonas sp.]|uniref:alpha-ketoglutarate-dependent dioxygenase AlkB n=1 Tax=Brevundimonas sp. TaxID=1871086 RepID=UPI00271C3CF4|nr:alpha-ketoglutarate-dependent dioxygenase AlkB [Brevundimonas sp.]MDO9588048.1 alpha-ketoglutarate-dependent dioxygenase AlkB [Brevundimonas sp.]MDP3369286.1 alpha-ketoglutarate-dependent dioxygenase AlkB [Brevundimonas sp.]MDP3655516.1 alpha-ketoglutarate-dependent dioxygenase AlkB [Brevundimonas sp.]MDZ4108327.1 alpha-ketoglutarate-dependent dioxygenase AlkB [Brevundimonas sp.]
MGRAREIDTGMEGFRFWPGALSASEQTGLLGAVLAAEASAPFYRPVTPGGRAFSVEMTGLGPLGWVSDRAGYRYQPTHPVTGAPWPPMPDALPDLWRDLTGWPEPPDACLVNRYRDGAKMGLHQDLDERDHGAPVLSVSLGDTAVFRIGAAGGGSTRTVRLASGDVCALTGPARLARHGIDRIIAGSSSLVPGGGRINLTLRRAL